MSQASAEVDGSKQPVDRRTHVRQLPRSLAYVELGEGNGGIVLNVSEGGIAVQAVVSLMGDELPSVRVQLAHSQKRIEAKGRITWTGGLRKTAGIEFVDLSQEANSLLRESRGRIGSTGAASNGAGGPERGIGIAKAKLGNETCGAPTRIGTGFRTYS
jgi:hypothetical protein